MLRIEMFHDFLQLHQNPLSVPMSFLIYSPCFLRALTLFKKIVVLKFIKNKAPLSRFILGVIVRSTYILVLKIILQIFVYIEALEWYQIFMCVCFWVLTNSPTLSPSNLGIAKKDESTGIDSLGIDHWSGQLLFYLLICTSIHHFMFLTRIFHE